MQADRNPRDAGRIGSHPLKTAEGGAASFNIMSRKIKSGGWPTVNVKKPSHNEAKKQLPLPAGAKACVFY